MEKMTIKDIEKRIFGVKDATWEDFFNEIVQDERKSVQTLIKRYKRQEEDKKRVEALYTYENEARNNGFEIIAGVDEAGRGPLAGPVSVAAVILPKNFYLPGLNDSKKLSAKKREELFDLINETALAISSVLIDAQTIDRINIYQATLNGMYEAVFALKETPDMVLVDAMELTNLPMKSQSIIKGDAKSASIAAASIIAKVTRDRLMLEYDKIYPEYGFAQHMGYGTAKHIEALRKFGPCPIHRRSFEPIASMV